MDPLLLGDAPGWLQGILGWIDQRPLLALCLLGAACLFEGLFLVGLIIPGSLLMFAAGAVTVVGDLPLWPIILTAGIGAWIGDLISFAIGYTWRHDLPALASRLRLGRSLPRAQAFFARHGGKSIFLGRFIGPLRPLVPAIAGGAAMRPTYFIGMDLLAAISWAFAYALPGIVVGATLSLAAEVATRLALLLALLMGGSWLIWWAISRTVRLAQRGAEPLLIRMMDWSHKHRRLGNLGPGLADPHQPESPVLAGSWLLLAALAALSSALLWGWPGETQPPAIDDTVYDWSAILLTAWSSPVAAMLARLSSPQSCLLLAGGLLMLFSFLRRPRTAAHWLAGLIGGTLLGLLLPGQGLAMGLHAALLPAWQLTLALSLWLLLGGLLASCCPPRRRVWLYLLSGIVIGLILLAQLMLGQASFSQAVLCLIFSLVWVALVMLGFRRHLRGGKVLPAGPSLALVAGLALLAQLALPIAAPRPPADPWSSGEAPQRINLLWEGRLGDIASSLQQAGWRPVPAVEGRAYLRWLLPAEPGELRPLAPQLLAGQPSQATFQRETTAGPSLILRLWPDPRAADRWIGQAGQRQLRRWAGLLEVPVMRRDTSALDTLQQDLAGAWRLLTDAQPGALLRVAPY